METPYTLPGDGSPIFVYNSGAPIRGYTLVNSTDVAVQLVDGLGNVVDTIGPSTRSVGRGNWLSLTAGLQAAATSGEAALVLTDQTPAEIGQSTAIASKVTAVSGNPIASAFLAVPLTITSDWTIDSGVALPAGALFGLAYLSLFAVPQSSSTLAVIACRWRLMLRVPGFVPGTVIATGGISIGAAAAPLPPVIPAQDARPQVVGVAGQTIQLDVDRRDPTNWTVNSLLAGFHCIFAPVNS